MTKKIIAVFLVLCLALCFTITAFADDMDELEGQKSELEAQQEQNQAALDKAEEKVDNQQAVVDELVSKVQGINEEIKDSQAKIRKLDKQIDDKETQIKKQQKEIDELMTTLKHRIKIIYISGDTSSIEIILGAKDFSDFLDKIELVKNVTNHDKKLIDNVKTKITALKNDLEELSSTKDEQKKEQGKLEEKQEELNVVLDENKETLATLEIESNDALNELNMTKEQLQEVEEEIKEQQAAEAASHSNYSTHAAGGQIDVDASGSWVWPAPGAYYISSPFYDSEDRDYIHGALDIADDYGTTIIAAKDGVVEYVCDECTHNWGKYYNCGCGGGYGNYVQIDHGGGFEAIYAHLQSVCVSSGQSVSAGTIIGYMGSTGHSTGAHLHFEVMYNGEDIDPMQFY